MPNTRKILRVFLASPGDLQDERSAIRNVVVEFNESWADALGYQIDLMGWEDTVSGFGRPQHLINQELDKCDLFIGMIWKRWGTPPDKDGGFTSGFHEEFDRSVDRRERDESPEISLFFKKIPPGYMADPGNDLKKVLDFREQIISEKKILFQEFSTVKEIEVLARRCITNFVNSVREAGESSAPDEDRAKRTEPKSEGERSEKVSPEDSPLMAEGLAFLEELVEKLGQKDVMDNISSSDIARFRLLANSISKPGNQDLDLGAHDANILYSARAEGVKFGKREIRCLARLGFRYLANENVPLWCWYSATTSWPLDEAILSSFFGTDDEQKIGAIKVLDALSRELPTDNDFMEKEWLIHIWFSDESSTPVRSAALNYLAKKGTAEDYSTAKKEYERNETGTSLAALECMLRILLRDGQEYAAQQLVLESQVEALNSDTLQDILDGFDNLDTETLLPGLEHRNATVRLRTLEILHGRDALEHNMIERLLEDSDASVRNEAIGACKKLGRSLKEEEIERILVQPKNQLGRAIMGELLPSNTDWKGKGLFQQYRLEQLKNLPEADLTRKIEVSLTHDDDAYFARAERYFKKHAEELRRDIDDTFSTYFEERIQRIIIASRGLPDSETLVQSTRELEEFSRKKLTRRGLDILCSKGYTEDLNRIRGNLQDGYAGASVADARYMRIRGEWTDIPLLAAPTNIRWGLELEDITNFQNEVAKALLNMGRSRSISSFFSIEIPAAILKSTISYCAVSRFSKISHEVLLRLFDHESADVRKAASIMAVRALSVKQIRSLLNEYIFSDKYRYYNVIHWLDLGASMTKDEARKVVLAASG